ncbi:MAG: hypothetical protein ACFFEW_14595 [Candidatus Thorarchaeota archaeon]
MKRHYVATIMTAIIMAVVLSLAVTAGDRHPRSGAIRLRFDVVNPRASDFFTGLFTVSTPYDVDTIEFRYKVFGGFDSIVTRIASSEIVTSPVIMPMGDYHMKSLYCYFRPSPQDTGHIRVAIYHENLPVDSLDVLLYLLGDSLGYFTEKVEPPPQPRDPRINFGRPLYFELEPITELKYPGDAELGFFITPHWYYDTLYIKVFPIGNLTYYGEPTYNVSPEIGDTTRFVFPISIPKQDTSALRVEIYDDKHLINGTRLYFVTTNDTVEVYTSKPIPPSGTRAITYTSHDYGPLYYRLDPAQYPIVVGRNNIKFSIRPGKYFDSVLFKVETLGNLQYHGDTVIHVPTDTGVMNEYLLPVTIPPNDSTGITLTIISDDHTQYGWAVYFTSTEDSVTFHRINPAPDKLDIEYPMKIIPLPENADTTIPQIEIIAPPHPSQPPTTNDSILKERRESRDNTKNKSESDEERFEQLSPSDRRSQTEHYKRPIRRDSSFAPLGQSGEWVLLYEYGFEDGLDWYAMDYNDTSGLDYWDTISVYESWGRSSEGIASAWCSRLGSRPVAAKYDTYMDSWLMIGFVLPTYDYIIFEFDIWYATEEDYDVCIPYYALDSDPWYPVDQYEIYTGFSYGWRYDETYAIDKPDNDTVYIGFRFYSDNIYTDTGVFIDNFRLWGWSDAQPDIVPMEYPGWERPLVPNYEEGTNWTEELQAYKRTYLDISLQNIGQATSESFYIELYFDGVPFDIFFVNGPFYPNQFAIAEDQVYIFEDGFHELAMFVDCFDDIAEANESNNYYSFIFCWDSAYIDVSGTAHYYDVGNGNALYDSRRVIVELWDVNAAYPDIKISSATDTIYTDDYGRFDFGQVGNYDPEGFLDELDLFIKVFAENPAARLFANPAPSGPVSFISSDTAFNVQNDIFQSVFALPDNNQSGRFYIIDRILDGYDKWHSIRPNDFIMKVDVNLNTDSTGYQTGMNRIAIDTSDFDPDYRPDTFDGDIIIEEYGHKLSRDFEIFDEGSQADHWWFSQISLEFGAAEAVSYFWSFLTRNNTTLVNRWNNFNEYRLANAETGEFYENGNLIGSANDSGEICEGAIACMLWDMFDNVDDDYNGDGVGDIFDAGINNMLDVMNAGMPDHIREFWSDWINSGYNEHHKMWAVWYEHGTNMDTVKPTGAISINGGADYTTSLIVDLTLNFTDTLSGMIPPLAQMNLTNNEALGPWAGWQSFSTTINNWDLSQYGGNSDYGLKEIAAGVTDAAENHQWVTAQIEYVECFPGDANGDEELNIGDATYILDYIFKNGPAPIPYPLASCDALGDCDCNVGDAIYIIDYMFKGGPAPVTCDQWIAACGRPIRK